MSNTLDNITFKYRFLFKDGKEKTFDVNLSPATFRYVPKQSDTSSEWTQLAFHKCPNCPLNEKEHPQCPVALNSVDLIRFFGAWEAAEEFEMRIETKDRNYTKKTDISSAFVLLLGVIMATSPCPVLEQLKPIARFHLPFASDDETKYRAISTYLLRQYFAFKQKMDTDWELAHFDKIFESINITGKAFLERLKNAKTDGAPPDPKVFQGQCEKHLQYPVTKNALEDIQQLYQAYFT